MGSRSRRTFLATAGAAAVGVLGVRAMAPAMAADDVKFAADPASPQPGLEANHVPRMTLTRVEAKEVAFGATAAGDFYRVAVQSRHEATDAHHIVEIALFVNGQNVAQYRIDPARAASALPAISAIERLAPGDEVMAVCLCNVHGKWGSRLKVA